MSFPNKISSSFCVADSVTSTPSNILTCRTFCRGISEHVRHKDQWYAAHLFAQEVADLNSMPVLLNNAVDWEMSIYGTHFVSESLLYL